MSLKEGMWNGEKCLCFTGSVLCGKPLRPTWWCAKHEGERLKCVKVLYQGQMFFIYDGDGSGSNKVFNTSGGPFCAGHKSIPVDDEQSFALDKPNAVASRSEMERGARNGGNGESSC